jgi:ATP-binding cassette, subfamily B, bacterial
LRQNDTADCGPACLVMISRFHGRHITLNQIKANSNITRHGVSLQRLSTMAKNMGYDCLEIATTFDKLSQNAPLPAIIHWEDKHYTVLYRIEEDILYIADPAKGKLKISKDAFLKGWLKKDLEEVEEGTNIAEEKGLVLLLEPTKAFYHADSFLNASAKSAWSFITRYLKAYSRNIIQLAVGLLIGSMLQIAIPFLTRAIVDRGIMKFDTHFIYTILYVQFGLYLSSTIIEFIRTWVFIHLSTRINVFIISDFLTKLMRLPVRFFDSKIIGDLTQRVTDHKRIEQFITDTLIRSLFSIFTILVFGVILYHFSFKVFLIFLVGTAIQLSWIFFFLKKQRVLDYEAFALQAQDNSKIFEIITGMNEIRMNNLELQKKREWEGIQSGLFSISLERLKVNQYEQGGTRFIGYLQMILILFFSALGVINQSLSLGAMMSILFIVGQLNTPINQLINFILSTQMAKISLGRLAEIHEQADEEPDSESKVLCLPESKDIIMAGVDFAYIEENKVLENINIKIPQGKITAIVGTSGSGKTTLLKLLLKFYNPMAGEITVGGHPLLSIKNSVWRDNCGSVLQDGFIFSDTVAYNITLSREIESDSKLYSAAKAANIHTFIESLPQKFNSKIGQDGFGLSHGQKQRILIARAIYKNPEYLFFDEATNSLDAKNEYVIMQNLNRFFNGRTVIIVAHRLSTVRNADQIIVLDDGKVAETGSHEQLLLRKDKYFSLVQNQVELGAKDYLNIMEDT